MVLKSIEVVWCVLWLCVWSLAQITLLLCRTWKSRLDHQYAPHSRARLLCWQALNGCCCKYVPCSSVLGERAALIRLLSTDWGFKPSPWLHNPARDRSWILMSWGRVMRQREGVYSLFSLSLTGSYRALFYSFHCALLKGLEMCHQSVFSNRPLCYSRCCKSVMHVVFLLAPLTASQPIHLLPHRDQSSPLAPWNPLLVNIIDDWKYYWWV